MRPKIAFLGGFRMPPPSAPHGTRHSAFEISHALARVSAFEELHVYDDVRERREIPEKIVLPDHPGCRLFDRVRLPSSEERYAGVYVGNGEQQRYVPFLLRQPNDWAPVICTMGTTHASPLWEKLFTSFACGSVRKTDGFIFKSASAMTLFRGVLDNWKRRFGIALDQPENQVVIPNGVDSRINMRSLQFRRDTRLRLRLCEEDVVFLSFSRLSPGTKGDHLALVARWKEVVMRNRRALLLLAGAQVDPDFLLSLRTACRVSGVSDRILILENPFAFFSDARRKLMSAADVFIHLSAGLQEASPLVVHEAMAHGLPVIASAWAGLPEIVSQNKSGFVVPVYVGAPSDSDVSPFLGSDDVAEAFTASRLAALDWHALIEAVSALISNETRHAMAEMARTTAESSDIESIARRHLEFIRETSMAAEKRWTGPTLIRPLVHLNEVLDAQARQRLTPENRICLSMPVQPDRPSERLNSCDSSTLQKILAIVESRPNACLGELSLLLTDATGDPSASQERAFVATSRIWIELINYGILNLVASD